MKRSLLWAVAASLLVAVVVTVASLLQTPTYEASAQVRVYQEQSDQQTNLAGGGEEVNTEGLPRIRIDIPEDSVRLQALTQTMAMAIESRPVAEGTIRRLGVGMSPADLLTNLTAQQVETSQFIRLSYTDTDPARAKEVVNAVGRESSEFLSAAAGADGMRATLYDKAIVPESPVSPKPLRNGLIALVVALALSAALFEARKRARMDEEQES